MMESLDGLAFARLNHGVSLTDEPHFPAAAHCYDGRVTFGNGRLNRQRGAVWQVQRIETHRWNGRRSELSVQQGSGPALIRSSPHPEDGARDACVEREHYVINVVDRCDEVALDPFA